MEISRFIPAGKLLTIVHDAGAWYSWASPQERFSVSAFSANYRFWNVLCSPKLKEALLAPFPPEQKAQALRSWAAHGMDLDASAVGAASALKGLCSHASFSSAELYNGLAADLSAHLDVVNRVQRSIEFSVQAPPSVREADYSSSVSLAAYALRTDTFFYRLTEAALSDFTIGEGGAVLFSVKSHLELLTAMSAAVAIRNRFPGAHLCLAEHRYEYFSLDTHMEKLKRSGALLKVFDSVIEPGNGSQGLIAALLESLHNGERASGFINADTYKITPRTAGCRRVPPDYPSSFSPEPVLWARLSLSGCYWGKCAFCAQGHQGEPGVPMGAFNPGEAAGYVADCVSAGYSKFSFSDEALDLDDIKDFCALVLEKKLEIRWSCRCRCDIPVEPETFRLMRRAGCREILFGMETVSERLQKLMCKYETSVSPAALERLLRTVNEAGLGIHLSFMGGFPGETPAELKATADFVKTVLKDMKGATYVFNQFEILPGSKMFKNPAAFQLRVEDAEGDMPLKYNYLPAAEIQSVTEETNSRLGLSRAELSSALGWAFLDSGPVAGILRYLYFSSGHGLLFKSSESSPFENPLQKAVPAIRA